MVISKVVTLFFYIISITFLPAYFGMFLLSFSQLRHADEFVSKDISFVVSLAFVWKVAVIMAISALPLYIIKLIHMRLAPAAASSKLL
jgi:phospholipid-translocating ATPase